MKLLIKTVDGEVLLSDPLNPDDEFGPEEFEAEMTYFKENIYGRKYMAAMINDLYLYFNTANIIYVTTVDDDYQV